MHLLVINSGSSSIKFSIFAVGEGEPRSLSAGEVTGIGSGHAAFAFGEVGKGQPASQAIAAETPMEAIGRVVEAVSAAGMPAIDAVGYRVVHPGPKITTHVRIDAGVMRELEEAVVFAPLHDPSAIKVIRATMEQFPAVPHFACFDTVFHGSMPEVATAYAIPAEYRERGVKRYGFHGLSCESVVEQMRVAGREVPRRMVIAHLGSGCSVTAVVDGKSVDTSMGLTPTGGVVMGTRPGDIDPGLVLYLLRDLKGNREKSFAAVETLLNYGSGVAALSGVKNDMKATREEAAKGNARAQLAIAVFTRSVRKALGSYAWLLGGLDTIVFTGGIGEHDARSRAEIVDGLAEQGISIDSMLNDGKGGETRVDVRRISDKDSKIEMVVVAAKEDWMIARHVQTMLGRR